MGGGEDRSPDGGVGEPEEGGGEDAVHDGEEEEERPGRGLHGVRRPGPEEGEGEGGGRGDRSLRGGSWWDLVAWLLPITNEGHTDAKLDLCIVT